MTLRPADLLECVRQMNIADRLEMLQLLNEANPPLFVLRNNDEGSEREMIDTIRSLIREGRNDITPETKFPCPSCGKFDCDHMDAMRENIQ